MRDLVQPARQGVSSPDRATLLHQDQEGSLEGVFSIVLVAEDRPADSHDHRAMPSHQGFEGPRVTLREKSLEEPPVREPRGHSLSEQAVELSQGSPQCLDGHVSESPRAGAL